MSISHNFLCRHRSVPFPCENGSGVTTGRNPVVGLWGHTLGAPPEPTSSYASHRLLMSTGCKSSHSGFLDVSCGNGGLRIRLDWPTVMFDDFLHQLVSGSLPS